MAHTQFTTNSLALFDASGDFASACCCPRSAHLPMTSCYLVGADSPDDDASHMLAAGGL